jgi:hypothetical protein
MAASIGDTFKPGQKVEASGIYDVIHDPAHDKHQVTCVYGDSFPPCNHCGHHVRFRLAVAATHVNNHEHFKKKR